MLSIMMFAASGYKHDKHATYRTYVTQLTNALNRLLFIVALCEQELSFIDTQFVEFPQFEATVRRDCSKRLLEANVRSNCSKRGSSDARPADCWRSSRGPIALMLIRLSRALSFAAVNYLQVATTDNCCWKQLFSADNCLLFIFIFMYLYLWL